MATLSSFCILLCVFFTTCLFAQKPTTPHLPEVFLGKCFEKNPTGTDCNLVWQTFSSAAAEDNAVVNTSSYVPFFQIADFSTPKSSILFWSGSMAFALAISSNDPRFVTVEETSTGFILNGLSWCGVPKSDPPAFDYTSPCYYPSNDTYFGTQGVWSEASTRFAHGASGDVYVLLQPAYVAGNPPTYQAYRTGSIFGQIELPAINVSQVDSFTVLLLKNTTLAPEEVCGGGTLAVLHDVVYEKFGFEPTCVDDPKLVYDIMCPPHSTSAQCLAATLVYTGSIEESRQSYLAWAIATTAATAVFVIIALALLIRNATRKGYEPIDYRRRSYHD